MCVAGRAAVAAGLVVGSGGNLSARLPGASTCWVTRAGTWLDRLTPDDFVEVAIADGAVVIAGRDAESLGLSPNPGPSTEVQLHLATYRVRPDVNAIVHLHPQLAVLLDALGETVRLITTDHAYYLRRVARVPFFPPGTVELAEAAAAAVADGTNCVILAHHGCSVLGADVAMAHRRASNLEEAARLTYQALLLTGGRPDRSIPDCPWDLPPPSPGLI
jgi:ribulose-5-phosphate 4-epimerase/fuculose-1-phosphate aldolase